MRRHGAGPHLLDDFLPHRRIRRGVDEVHAVECEVARARAGVVAREAVLPDDLLVRRRPAGRRRSRGRRRLLHDQEQVVGVGGDGQAPRPRAEGHRHGGAIARHERAAGGRQTRERGVDVADVELQSKRPRILHAPAHDRRGRPFQLEQLEQQRGVRHLQVRQPVLRPGRQSHHARHGRVGRERPRIAGQAEALAVEPERAGEVRDRDSQADADHVAGGGCLRRRQRIELCELHEVPIGILHDDRARLVCGAHGQRRATRGHDRHPGSLQLRKCRIEIADQQNQRRGAGSCSGPYRLSIDAIDLHEFDPAANARHARADETQS